MALRHHYKYGDYLFICQQCNRAEYGSRGRMGEDPTQRNLFLCPRCLDHVNMQYYVRGVADHQRVPIARPRQTDVFVDTNEVTPESL